MTRDEYEAIIAEIPTCIHKDKAEEPHSCPYKSDVNNDNQILCRCCHECAQNCADDI